MADNGVQNEPVMAGSNDASNEEKVAGILAQTRHDFAGGGLTDVLEKLHERFAQAQVEASDIELARYAHEISGT